MNNVNKKYRIGIAGLGMVGGAMERYFEKKGLELKKYDPGKKVGSLKELNEADVVFACVPTPYLKDGKGFDLSYVEQTAKDLKGNKIIVIKSTVLPGTTEKLQEKYSNHTFIFNPEFLTEATADQDMEYPDRQIIGYTKKRESKAVSGSIMQMLPLSAFERVMPATEAEMVKYFGNTWFSLKVSFANQMHDLCEKLGIDYDTVRDAAAADKRIGRTHLKTVHKGYRGYGGKCLPKDTRALIQLADSVGYELSLHKMAEEYNNALMEEQGIENPEDFSIRD